MTDIYLRQRIEEKEQAIFDIEEALARVGHQGRDVDDWECVNIADAIGCTMRGMYRAGSALAKLALTPPGERVSVTRPPQLEGWTAERLLRALEFARNQELIPHPIFR